MDGGEGQLRSRAESALPSGRVWLFHLLEERGPGKRVKHPFSPLFNTFFPQEGDVIELCQVSDIRAGGLPKDSKLLDRLINKHGNDWEEKSLTVCTGTNYINITYQHIVCPSVEISKVAVMILLRNRASFRMRFYACILKIHKLKMLSLNCKRFRHSWKSYW